MSKPENQTALLDNAILLALQANNTSFGMERNALRFHVRQFGGGTPTEVEVEARLEYLTDKNFVQEVAKAMHKAIRAWKITGAGRQYLDDQNL